MIQLHHIKWSTFQMYYHQNMMRYKSNPTVQFQMQYEVLEAAQKFDLKCDCWKLLLQKKKYVLSKSESVQCNFFIFDHVTFTQFKICCCVQNFVKSGFFTEIWRYIDFQNGGCPPYWYCFTTIWDNPWSLCCWPQLPVKFHVNLIHRSEDKAIWIFLHI